MMTQCLLCAEVRQTAALLLVSSTLSVIEHSLHHIPQTSKLCLVLYCIPVLVLILRFLRVVCMCFLLLLIGSLLGFQEGRPRINNIIDRICLDMSTAEWKNISNLVSHFIPAA